MKLSEDKNQNNYVKTINLICPYTALPIDISTYILPLFIIAHSAKFSE